MNNISHTRLPYKRLKILLASQKMFVNLRLTSFECHKLPKFYKIWFQLRSPAYCLPSRVFGSLSLTGNNLIINWHHSKLSEKLFFVLVKFTAAHIFTLLLLRWIPPNLPLGFVEKRNRYKQTNNFGLNHYCAWISAILSLIMHP